MDKRAQITIYIILGFVVLIAAGVLLFFQGKTVNDSVQTEIPGEAQFAGQTELRSFMDSCMRDAVFNGMEIIRLQAGYIDFPPGTPTTIVQNNENEQIVEENGIKKVVIDPNGNGNEAAYWLDSDNRLLIPSQEFIQDELADYVKRSVTACVNDFSSFKSQNYIVETGEMNVHAEFSDEVLVKLDYPITFERNDVKFDEEEFLLRLPIDIQEAIALQTDIVVAEYYGAFLEANIKYLLSLYSYNGGDKSAYDLPPLSFTDASPSCSMQTWQLGEVREKLLDNLNSNAKYFKIKGLGETIPDTGNDISDGVYKGLTSDILLEEYNNINFSFEVNEDNLFIDVKPRNGELIRPARHTATGIPMLPLFCNTKYQFKYTLKIPMMAKATLLGSPSLDTEARALVEGENFEFSVPIGVNLCGNQNRECTGKPAYVYQNITLDESKLNFTVPKESMFCKVEQRKSQPMKIRTLDAYTFSPVPDVAVFYRCGSAANDCIMDVSNNEGVLETNMPICYNGELYALKDGYGESVMPLTTEPGEELRQVDYLVEPLKELNVEVRLVNLKEFMPLYYVSDRCGSSVDPLFESTVSDDDFNVMINSNYGASTVALVYPEMDKTKVASGKYGFTYLVEGEATINPYEFQGQSISLNKNGGGSYKGSYIFGSYSGIDTEFVLDDVKDADKIVFYVPIETDSKELEVTDMGGSVQADGSLLKTMVIDDDCDASTPPKKTDIIVSPDEVDRIFSPRLE